MSEAKRFSVGDLVRICDDVDSSFAGRGAIIKAIVPSGYDVSVGVADDLWFADDELEPRVASPALQTTDSVVSERTTSELK